MRKLVKYIEISSLNVKYMFKGVSFLDLQNFVIQNKLQGDIRIYQDIPHDEFDNQPKLKDLKFYKHVKKKTAKFDTGDDCFVLMKNEREIFNKTCYEIFYETKECISFENISILACFHDVDWIAIIIFKDDSLFNMFLKYLLERTEIIKETNEKAFYD